MILEHVLLTASETKVKSLRSEISESVRSSRSLNVGSEGDRPG